MLRLRRLHITVFNVVVVLLPKMRVMGSGMLIVGSGFSYRRLATADGMLAAGTSWHDPKRTMLWCDAMNAVS